jgi:hypothetical protein
MVIEPIGEVPMLKVKPGDKVKVQGDSAEVLRTHERGIEFTFDYTGGGYCIVRFAPWSIVTASEPPKAKAGVRYRKPEGDHLFTGGRYFGRPNGTVWDRSGDLEVPFDPSTMIEVG